MLNSNLFRIFTQRPGILPGLLAFACTILLLSCSKPSPEEGEDASESVPAQKASSKIFYPDGIIEKGSILVKLEEAVSEQEALQILEDLGVEKVIKVFGSVKGKENLESLFGLDRWYEAFLADGMGVDVAANEIAAISQVVGVQLVGHVRKASDCISFPYEETSVNGPITKASASASLPFNDPSLPDQWHYYNQGSAAISKNAKKGADINVLDVWNELSCGDPEIIVAVIDEGVKYSHPDLKSNIWVNSGEIPDNGIDDDGNGYIDDVHGYNFVDNGAISWTKSGDSGHGTHCAGTIAAVNNNNLGVSGVAGGSGKGDGCKIMSCQIFSGNSGGNPQQTAKAIKYAADNGASVISCSFGYNSAFASDNAYIGTVGSLEIDAIHYFEASSGNNPVITDGNIAIFAAGNEAHDFAHYPGAFYDIISVTAFAPDYLPTYYTNYGPGCNIVAPGGEYYHVINSPKSAVLSTLPSELNSGNDYGYMQGTSMACPHVSGITALALSYAKKLGKKFTRQQFKELIITSANDLDSRLTGTKSYAYGRGDLDLSQFYHKLGTGSIDTWLLMMQIEGIRSLTAATGKKQWLDLSPYFGTASTSLTYLDVEVSDAARNALGLIEDPYIEYGRLWIHPTKCGSGKIKVKAIGGGSNLGGNNNPPGGMEVSHDISVIARSIKSNNGGWL